MDISIWNSKSDQVKVEEHRNDVTIFLFSLFGFFLGGPGSTQRKEFHYHIVTRPWAVSRFLWACTGSETANEEEVFTLISRPLLPFENLSTQPRIIVGPSADLQHETKSPRPCVLMCARECVCAAVQQVKREKTQTQETASSTTGLIWRTGC